VKEFSASPARVAPLAAEVQEKVQAGIKVSVEQGGGEVKMKLNPESLGEVRIKLNVASGVVKAEITVENIEVKRIIESDSAFLRDSLGAHGLTLDKCVVEVGRSFEAGTREKSGESFSGDEQRPMKDREHEKENRENSGWQHRHFRKNYARHEDGGVDFFI
jgi:flagellar hook-length control protein FliK